MTASAEKGSKVRVWHTAHIYFHLANKLPTYENLAEPEAETANSEAQYWTWSWAIFIILTIFYKSLQYNPVMCLSDFCIRLSPPSNYTSNLSLLDFTTTAVPL